MHNGDIDGSRSRNPPHGAARKIMDDGDNSRVMPAKDRRTMDAGRRSI